MSASLKQTPYAFTIRQCWVLLDKLCSNDTFHRLQCHSSAGPTMLSVVVVHLRFASNHDLQSHLHTANRNVMHMRSQSEAAPPLSPHVGDSKPQNQYMQHFLNSGDIP